MRPTSSSSVAASSATTRKTASACRSCSTRTGGRGSTPSGRARARSRRRSSAAPQARIRRLRGEPRPTQTNVEITPDPNGPLLVRGPITVVQPDGTVEEVRGPRSAGVVSRATSRSATAAIATRASRDDRSGQPRAAAVRGDRRRRARGVLFYREREDELVLVHTEVEEAFEGQGIGGRLVAAALDDIRARGLRMRPFCPFVKSYLERHPEKYDGLIAA